MKSDNYFEKVDTHFKIDKNIQIVLQNKAL